MFTIKINSISVYLIFKVQCLQTRKKGKNTNTNTKTNAIHSHNLKWTIPPCQSKYCKNRQRSCLKVIYYNDDNQSNNSIPWVKEGNILKQKNVTLFG